VNINQEKWAGLVAEVRALNADLGERPHSHSERRARFADAGEVAEPRLRIETRKELSKSRVS